MTKASNNLWEDENSVGSFSYNYWAEPILIDVIEGFESLTLVYKQYPNFTTTTGSSAIGYMPPRIYKIIYSIQDGQWHKSDEIEGTFLEAQEESYTFDSKT